MAAGRRTWIGPKGPFLLACVMGLLALAAIVTGILDIARPIWTGGEPFQFIFAVYAAWGAPAVFLYILVHNLGLASLLGGWGFFAAAIEKDPHERWKIAPILAGAVFLSIATGIQYIFQAGWHSRNELLALATVEALAIVTLTVIAYRELEDYVPTPAVGWGLVKPMARLAPAFLWCGTALALAAAWEALTISGAL